MSDFSTIPSLQPLLRDQVASIQAGISGLKLDDFLGCLLHGSVARGEATYRSDVDLLLIISRDQLTYSDVQDIRDRIENHFAVVGKESALTSPLPVQTTIVKDTVFDTAEPEMRKAIKSGIILSDPFGRIEREKIRLGAK